MADKARTSGICPAIISQLKTLKTEPVEPIEISEPPEPDKFMEPSMPKLLKDGPKKSESPVGPIEPIEQMIEAMEPIKMEPTILKLKIPRLEEPRTKLTKPKELIIEPILMPLEPPLTSLKKEYNLRSKKVRNLHNVRKKFKYQPETTDQVVWVPKAKNCFRDLLLVQTDLQNYHKHKTEPAQKIVDQYKTIQKSQIDSFVIGSNKFLAIACLSTLRLFEYKSNYVEVKRLPQRYISLDPNLITSVHYSGSKFFIAHLWGDNEDTSDDEEEERNLTSPYIVARDIVGKRIGKPYHYDKVIRSIYTDDIYLYALSCQNVLYVHQKALYSFSHYRIDFSDHLTNPVISAWIWKSTYEPYTLFRTIAATSKEIIMTHFDTHKHRREAIWPIEENYQFVSIENLSHGKKKQFLVHQNVKDFGWNKRGSKIEIIRPDDKEILKRIELVYRILQVKIHNKTIYLFGFKKHGDKAIFEVGQIDLELKPLCTFILPPDVDVDFRLTVHDDHIALVRNSSTIVTIVTTALQLCVDCATRIPECDKQRHKSLDHRTMFTGMILDEERRKYAQ